MYVARDCPTQLLHLHRLRDDHSVQKLPVAVGGVANGVISE